MHLFIVNFDLWNFADLLHSQTTILHTSWKVISKKKKKKAYGAHFLCYYDSQEHLDGGEWHE